MMMDLYDQDRILEIHIASEKRIAAEEAAKKAAKKATIKAAEKAEKEKAAVIERMLRSGKLSVEEIAEYAGVSVERVREIDAAMLQEA